MRKKLLMKVFSIILPAMAVVLATTGDSVTVWNSQTGVMETYSYFSLVPVASLQMCTPVAAILAAVTAILAVIHVVKASKWSLVGIYWTAFASTMFAVIPVLFRGDVLVIPNAVFPILMFAEWLLAAYLKKKAAEPEVKASGKKLKARK